MEIPSLIQYIYNTILYIIYVGPLLMNTFPSRFKNVEIHSYSGHITASR